MQVFPLEVKFSSQTYGQKTRPWCVHSFNGLQTRNQTAASSPNEGGARDTRVCAPLTGYFLNSGSRAAIHDSYATRFYIHRYIDTYQYIPVHTHVHTYLHTCIQTDRHTNEENQITGSSAHCVFIAKILFYQHVCVLLYVRATHLGRGLFEVLLQYSNESAVNRRLGYRRN